MTCYVTMVLLQSFVFFNESFVLFELAQLW